MDAVKIANAAEFIEGNDLEDAFDDDAKSLREALEHELYAELIKEKLGAEDYDKKLQVLKELEAKEKENGLFRVDLNIIDKRTDEEKGGQELHPGYDVTCGNRGGKLSGG